MRGRERRDGSSTRLLGTTFLAGALALALATGCTDGAAPIASSAPSATPGTPAAIGPGPAEPAAAEPGAPRARGLAEARIPEPFTLEKRFLFAASQNDRTTAARALELGAKLDAKDDLGRSALFLAVMDGHGLELTRWLHEKGLPVDDPDVSGRTPLSFAADFGLLEIARYLVAEGAAVDSRDVQQRTPLLHAAGGNHPDLIALLIDAGADENVRDHFGDTPLIVACAKGNVAAAAMLLRRGADTSLRDQEGRTAKERSAPDAGPCLSLPE